jgi:RNA polymerase sigma-70 factor (ECF subfamily)
VRSEKRHTDADLIRRCLDNDQEAYSQLLGRYRRQVLGLVWRMVNNKDEAQDLAQEAFIRAFRSLHTFDVSRSFPAWLYRITTNLCVDYYRRKKLDTISLVQGAGQEHEERTIDLVSSDVGPDEELAGRESTERLDAMVRTLPAAYRIVVLLRHQSDMAYEEIAEALNLPLGTVKARIHRAHKMLKEKLERWG